MSEIRDKEKVRLTIIGILHSAGVKSYDESQKATATILSIPELVESIKAYKNGYKAGIEAVQSNPDAWSGTG